MGQRACECYPDSNATKTFTKYKIEYTVNSQLLKEDDHGLDNTRK